MGQKNAIFYADIFHGAGSSSRDQIKGVICGIPEKLLARDQNIADN
jgi:hypothetical protein